MVALLRGAVKVRQLVPLEDGKAEVLLLLLQPSSARSEGPLHHILRPCVSSLQEASEARVIDEAFIFTVDVDGAFGLPPPARQDPYWRMQLKKKRKKK